MAPTFITIQMFFQNLNLFNAYSLSPLLQNAVLEVSNQIKVPMELATASALGALSLACQDKYDVVRPNGTASPCSLSLITIANSGDRKTTCDRLFMRPILEMESAAEQAGQTSREVHEAELILWKLEKKAIEKKLRKLENPESSADPESLELKAELLAHLVSRPKPPIVRSLILRDATPEAIGYHLHTVSKSAGLMSDEAGQILNGRALGQLPMLNSAWDGSELKVNRKNSESYTVRNPRLTISLMVQEATWANFLEGKGALARDNGFLARGLFCKPTSMQGSRQINSIDATALPHLEVFQRRITAILGDRQPSSPDAPSQPIALEFCSDAKSLWVDFANYIEQRLLPNGEYFQVRDAASKAAENAARLAALLHISEGQNGDIQKDTIHKACQISEWYLREFVRIFCPPPSPPQEQMDAMALDSWLREQYRITGKYFIRRNDCLQRAPSGLRKKVRLDAASLVLIQANIIRQVPCNNSKTVFFELYVQSYPYLVS